MPWQRFIFVLLAVALLLQVHGGIARATPHDVCPGAPAVNPHPPRFTVPLCSPHALTADGAGNLYVVDDNSYPGEIDKLTPDGSLTVLGSAPVVEGYGGEDAARAGSYTAEIAALAVGPDGTLYGVDRIVVFAIGDDGVERIVAGGTLAQVDDRTGQVVASAAPGNQDGPVEQATFGELRGIAVAPDGTIYLADQGNHRIRALTTDGQVRAVAGSGQPGTADGLGRAASFVDLGGLDVDGTGTLYVADSGSDGHSSDRVRRVRPDGSVSTLARVADGGFGFAPFSVAVDGTIGTVYAADVQGLYRLTPAGGVTRLGGQLLPTGFGVTVGPHSELYVSVELCIDQVQADGTTVPLAGGCFSLPSIPEVPRPGPPLPESPPLPG